MRVKLANLVARIRLRLNGGLIRGVASSDKPFTHLGACARSGPRSEAQKISSAPLIVATSKMLGGNLRLRRQSRSCSPAILHLDLDGARRHGLSTTYFVHLGALITRRHLEGEVEGRKILARMIVGVSQLRDAEIVRPGLNAFIDSGVEIDVVHARRAGRFHENLDIALAV